MANFNGFRGKAKRIDDIDLPKLGHEIGVGEDEVHAFIDAETTGTGFDDQGRPKMLFEGHVFYRNLPKSKRQRALDAGLAWKTWGQRKPYLKDSYPRLVQAMKIDETAALKACSWGLAQVLGENHLAAGYETVQEMVRAMMADEENHLAAAVNFIKANNLDDELRAHDWSGFARGYNGPGYRKNDYHTELAKRYAWWSRKPDTPWTPGQTEVKFENNKHYPNAVVESEDVRPTHEYHEVDKEPSASEPQSKKPWYFFLFAVLGSAAAAAWEYFKGGM